MRISDWSSDVCSSDLTQGGGMGEGWSDVDSLLLAVRPNDVGAGSSVYPNDHYQGAYPTGFYVIPSYYFGIRRAPYSTRMDVNPLTFKHIDRKSTRLNSRH